MRTIIYFGLILLTVISCEEIIDGGGECPENASCLPTEEMMQSDLDSMRAIIIEIVQSSSCIENTECHFVGFGSKPCGGPWEYLIYSNSMDTANLFFLIEEYYQLEYTLNTTYGRGSDCAVPNEPDSVICESEGCVAYYQGNPFTDNVCCD